MSTTVPALVVLPSPTCAICGAPAQDDGWISSARYYLDFCPDHFAKLKAFLVEKIRDMKEGVKS